MGFIVNATTDIGSTRETNQDSACVKCARWNGKEIVMAIVCDGMGGLAKGELASATLIRFFDKWFEEELPYLLPVGSLEKICQIWVYELKKLDQKIHEYGEKTGNILGTTFTGMLAIDRDYFLVHIGDTRAYHIAKMSVVQLTTDHTYIARELEAGRMTMEEAKKSPKRNTLTQCIGASRAIHPEVRYGKMNLQDTILICSDGFRHRLRKQELMDSFGNNILLTKELIGRTGKELVELVMHRGEKDNITVVVVRYECEKA